MKVFLAIIILGSPAFSTALSQERFTVEGKAVIFFAPSFQDLEASSEQEQREMEKFVLDLQFYRDQIKAFLKVHKIQDLWTDSPQIEIAHSGSAPIVLERKALGKPVGLILADSERNPKVSPGVYSYIELVLMIRRYFRLE